MSVEITPADGNIFADLGLADAEEMRHKTDLLVAIMRILKERRNIGRERDNSGNQ